MAAIASSIFANEDALWNAVQARDAARDGEFFYGVMTTGVYCRPSCRSRRPLRRNIRFFASAEAAERAGLRPCKRCRPNGTPVNVLNQVVHELARRIEAQPESKISLAQLARRAGYSPFHLQRSFKAIIGVTPKEYQTAARLRVFKQQLRQDAPVADAIYQAGFGSGSRVYEKADGHLGMTPSEYRNGGKGLMISYATGRTPLGLMMIGATDRGICFLQFGENDQALLAELQQQFPAAAVQPMPDSSRGQFESWMAALNRHLRGIEPRLDLPLDVRGTAVQRLVWRYLQKVAAAMGKPGATRAVARACATNSVAMLIPCHRVVRGSGELGGYRWGVQRKRVLLDTERAVSKR
jgi:AraC family transcriptional regulator of adaptative response/methylated-DNA-[protein]-cysteine methyltransferase